MSTVQGSVANASERIPFYRNIQTIGQLLQTVFGIFVAVSMIWLLNNMVDGLARQNMRIQFSFMNDIAGFHVSEGLDFKPENNYWRAFYVGTVNTIFISALAILLSTIIGIIFGVARISHNFLLRALATAYVELLRNIPLLVLLFMIYSLILKLPGIRQAIEIPGKIFLSNRGFIFPWLIANENALTWSIYVALACLISMATFFYLRHKERVTGLPQAKLLEPILIFFLISIVSLTFLPAQPFALSLPQLQGFNFTGGLRFSSEFMGLLIGLTLYTGAFIAEVVRSGLLAVHKGQTEAALALGLSRLRALRLVIFPQALRVIFPPLANIYLSLLRNSTLGIAIGYADQFQVSMTIMNQSGNAIPVMLLIMSFHLTISAIIAGIINWFNAKTNLSTK